METIEEFETFVRDRVVALHMGPSAGFIISANTSALHPKSFSTMDSGPLKNSGISWMNWYS